MKILVGKENDQPLNVKKIYRTNLFDKQKCEGFSNHLSHEKTMKS